MKYLNHVLFAISFFCVAGCQPLNDVKRIKLYQNQVSVEVPATWKYQERYRRYSNYQIKYDAQISDTATESVLTVDVYDSSRMYNIQITDELLDSFKGVQFKTKGQSVKFIERKVIKIEDHDIGLLKYTFESPKNKVCYGAQIFFRTSGNDFYEMEVYSLSQPVAEFKTTVDKVIESLRFNHLK